jgi:hypothetical protein
MRKLIMAFHSFTNAPKTLHILGNDVFFDVAPFGEVEFCVTSHRTAYFIMPAMTSIHLTYEKVKQFRYRPGVAQRVPGS